MKMLFKRGTMFCIFLAFAFVSSVYSQNSVTSIRTPVGVPTFECIGVSCSYAGDANNNSTCAIEYRKKGFADWKTGYPMWVDRKWKSFQDREYRGSLVNLSPNTTYEIRITPNDPDGKPGSKLFEVQTWNETFPIGKTVYVSNQATELSISESGTADGYILFTNKPGSTATIDVANAANNCITIKASYVVIRGLVIKGH